MADQSVVQLGVRMHPVDDLRRIGVSGGSIYAVFGVTGLIVNRRLANVVAHPGPHIAANLVLVAFGIGIVVGAKTLADDLVTRVFPIVALVGTLAAPPGIVVGLATLGYGSFQAMAMLFVLALIYGFYLLVRPLAVLMLVETGVSLVVLFRISHGIVGATDQAILLILIFGFVGFEIGTLVDALHTSAESERAARAELAALNESLETRVADQVDELERLGEMRRFLPAQVADAIMTSGGEALLEPHRREIAVLFADLRGFTRFAGEVEPEDVLRVMSEYHAAFGREVSAFGATVGSFTGDGVMAYLNDPYPSAKPATHIVELGLAFARAMRELSALWARDGYDLACGIGIAMGHATLGVVGFDGRRDYTALGTSVNLAARLCDAAQGGQILIDRRVHNQIAGEFETRQLQDRPLKGFASPVATYEVVAAS